ncbi:hypothetical protein GS892_25005 [Rhodococcus hoagii]|uniref:hypothetical protein n=1 Tax=Rhodococcus hoagii TaxID=43767 RepID=UPI000A10FF61|nr:hypothetical protein [Prescottella equi]NKV08571.1 hypothetical protein [Prescottella equi]NKV08596.1 hypothetical protein [Prescottella equi]NKV09572.1 hypothetical protein [Prescottella equi]ORL30440.1 hypothetical protein A6I91_21115 [Prescottella equi]
MSQDLVRARRGVSSGPDTHAEQAETALAAAVHENNELRAENTRMREWQRRVALALGMAEEVPGIGVHMAKLDDIVERAASLSSMELEHIECPRWCDECEGFEAWQSCTHCNGSGCGPGTASGAYEECEWCAGDGREHDRGRERTRGVLAEVADEHRRQDEEWGEQDHRDELRAELVQAAAVTVRWIEKLDRQHGGER